MTDDTRGNDWAGFLTCWSAEWADAQLLVAPEDFDENDRLPRERRWLGFPGADAAHLAALETRIGHRLPPSYRSFLELTDGWRHAGGFVWRLAGTAEAGLLGAEEADRFAGYESYLVENDPSAEMIHRSRLWHRAVRIDAEADVGILVLDPGDVGPDGEWAVYSWHSWKAEPTARYASFRTFMHAKYREFHRLASRHGLVTDTTRSLDAAVEFAREEALAGRWERAANICARAAQFGRPGADEPVRCFDAFLGHHQRSGLHDLPTDPAHRAETLPARVALAVRHRGRGPEELTARQPAEVRDLARSIHAGTFAYEPPGTFRDVVDRARESARWGDCDGAWRILRAGLPLWTLPGDDIPAPIGLLADPLLGPVITPERGRELLATPRAGRTGPIPTPTPDLDPDGLAWLGPNTWDLDHGYRFVLVEGVPPTQLPDLFGRDDGDTPPGLAAPATAHEQPRRTRGSRERPSANPWGDHPVMAVGRAGPNWSFAFAAASGHPDPDRLRSPAARASRSTPNSRAVVVWCTPGARRKTFAPWSPSALHVSVAQGGETRYALTVTVPSASTDPRSPQRPPTLHRTGTPPEAFAPAPALTAPAAIHMPPEDWHPHHERFLRAIAEEFTVTLPRHALLHGRLHSFESTDWSRAPRQGDSWITIESG